MLLVGEGVKVKFCLVRGGDLSKQSAGNRTTFGLVWSLSRNCTTFGLVWSLSCRCRDKFSTQSDQPCRNLSHLI